MMDYILYTGNSIKYSNGDPLLITNTVYRIAEPWDFSEQNIIDPASEWIFFIYDESKATYPRGYVIGIEHIKHPRNKIIQDIINS
jgi:hypothetical protein